MRWSDEGIVLSTSRYGDKAIIAEIFTKDHGRSMGLLRASRSRSNRYLLGDLVLATWNARLETHLGRWQLELEQSRGANLLSDQLSLHLALAVAEKLRLLPQSQADNEVYTLAARLTSVSSDEIGASASSAAQAFIAFEMFLLARLGFGLNLDACALTGEQSDLCYVSPTSGRACSRSAGEPWKDRLLKLPKFMCTHEGDVSLHDLQDGFELLEHFFKRHFANNRADNYSPSKQSEKKPAADSIGVWTERSRFTDYVVKTFDAS